MQVQQLIIILSKVPKRTIDGKLEIKCAKCGLYCCERPRVVAEDGLFYKVTDEIIQKSITLPSINSSNYSSLNFQPNDINQSNHLSITYLNPQQNHHLNAALYNLQLHNHQNTNLSNPSKNNHQTTILSSTPKFNQIKSKTSSIKRKRLGGKSARIDDLRITRGVSNYLQEVNTTRHRYELSGASPLKWIKNKEEFDRPLTKEASLRYKN